MKILLIILAFMTIKVNSQNYVEIRNNEIYVNRKKDSLFRNIKYDDFIVDGLEKNKLFFEKLKNDTFFIRAKSVTYFMDAEDSLTNWYLDILDSNYLYEDIQINVTSNKGYKFHSNKRIRTNEISLTSSGKNDTVKLSLTTTMPFIPSNDLRYIGFYDFNIKNSNILYNFDVETIYVRCQIDTLDFSFLNNLKVRRFSVNTIKYKKILNTNLICERLDKTRALSVYIKDKKQSKKFKKNKCIHLWKISLWE